LFSVALCIKFGRVCFVVWLNSSEQDAVIAEQLQSAEVVDRENERMQIELKDEVRNLIYVIYIYTHQK